MSNWEESIVKRSISEWIVEECLAHLPNASKQDWIASLTAEVRTPTDLKTLRSAVQKLKKQLPEEVFESVQEELREIADDAKWIKTKRGKYVLALNKWVEPFHAEFRLKSQFANVAIGAHDEREVVFASGFVSSQEVFHELLKYVASKNPPFKVMSDVHIGSWSGPRAE